MDGLSAAASVMGGVQFTGNVLKLLYDYMQAAKHAKDDIETLAKTLTELGNLLKSANELIEGSYGDKYKTAKGFTTELQRYNSYLAEIASKLQEKLNVDSGDGNRKRKRDNLGRALRWPFEKNKFTEIVQKLQEFQERLSDALNVDYT